MSRPEDGTFEKIRTLSEKEADENGASITCHGGIHVKKNIRAAKLAITQTGKIKNDFVVGGLIYCPLLYHINETEWQVKKDLLPYPGSLHRLGAVKCPWNCLYTEEVQATKIFTRSFVAMRSKTRPALITNAEETVLYHPLSISTNDTILMQTFPQKIETYVPNFQRWNAFSSDLLPYSTDILTLKKSFNILCVDGHDSLHLKIDLSCIPDDTLTQIYFADQNVFVKKHFTVQFLPGGQTFSHHAKRVKIYKCHDILFFD